MDISKLTNDFYGNSVNVNVNVKNIYRWRRMSRVRIGGAGGRRNVRPCRM